MAKESMNPALGQQKLEEVKAMQTAGSGGGGWFGNFGMGFGGAGTGLLSGGGPPAKEPKTYKTSLTYM